MNQHVLKKVILDFLLKIIIIYFLELTIDVALTKLDTAATPIVIATTDWVVVPVTLAVVFNSWILSIGST